MVQSWYLLQIYKYNKYTNLYEKNVTQYQNTHNGVIHYKSN